MKTMKLYLTLIIMTMVCVTTFSACGSDDDDERIEHIEEGDITTGTHRIDLSFEGTFGGWDVSVGFVGSPTSGSLYENGQKLATTEGTNVWLADDVRSYSVSTDDRSTLLMVEVTMMKRSAAATPVTIRLKSFVNGQQKKTKTIVVNSDVSAKSIFFASENTAGDMEFDYNY